MIKKREREGPFHWQ